ncbi:MAG: ATP phosphoribosyltransferase [Oscillospiraceae bacterium]|nr:ATP phosphoribosyltransferase [Oscillospiraceae bacterium]
MDNNIRIALTKGRLEKETLKLFGKMGWDVSQFADKGRKLIFALTAPGVTDSALNVEIVLAKSPDVITYVEMGVCDIGVTGKDMIAEYADDSGNGNYFEVLDLGFGRCKFALIAEKGVDFYKGHSVKTIASKYTNVARRFFEKEKKGMCVDIVKIEGSVELAPLLGLADGIVDIVETGATLKENGLEVIEDISGISARVIVNPVKMKMKKSHIELILKSMENALKGQG